jgi:hypothetical protein
MINLNINFSVDGPSGPQDAMQIVRKSMQRNSGAVWKRSKIIILDAPRCLGDLEERLLFCAHYIKKDEVQISKFWKVYDIMNVFVWKSDSESRETNGILLYQGNVVYIEGNTLAVQKIKTRIIEGGIVLSQHPSKVWLEVEL